MVCPCCSQSSVPPGLGPFHLQISNTSPSLKPCHLSTQFIYGTMFLIVRRKKMVCLLLYFHFNIHSITLKVTGGLLDEVCFLLLINGSTSGSIISVTCQLGFLSSVLFPFFIILVAAFTGFQIVEWEISGTPLLTPWAKLMPLVWGAM